MFDDSNSNNGYLLDFGGIEPSIFWKEMVVDFAFITVAINIELKSDFVTKETWKCFLAHK
jgi:hypothetical protein